MLPGDEGRVSHVDVDLATCRAVATDDQAVLTYQVLKLLPVELGDGLTVLVLFLGRRGDR